MRPISGQILTVYNDLMNRAKTLASSVFHLHERANNTYWAQACAPLSHPHIVDEILFEVRERIDRGKIELKIRAKCVHQSPCFRFDSAGPTHENRYDDVPLPMRPVPTPHFQRFDASGRWWAYHTPELADTQFVTMIRQQIEQCLRHFFTESRIACQAVQPVQVQRSGLFTPQTVPVHDPHVGVNFP